MFEIIAFGLGLWLGFYWGKYKTLPPAFDDIKDEVLSEDKKGTKDGK